MATKLSRTTIQGNTVRKTLDVLPEANSTAFAVSEYSLTGSAAHSLLDLAVTWDTVGAPSAIKLDVLNTNSDSASRLLDLQVGSVAKFFVGLDGSFVSTGIEFDLGSTANANNTIKFVRPAASGINMIDFDAISGAPNLSFVRKYTASPFRMELAGPTDVDIVIDSNNDGSSNSFRVLHDGIDNTGTVLFSVNESGAVTFAGALTLPYRATAVTTTFLATDYTVDATSGTFTVNLPTAVGITGRIYVVKNSGAGTITLDGSGAELIDGSATATVVSGAALTVHSTGAAWIII